MSKQNSGGAAKAARVAASCDPAAMSLADAAVWSALKSLIRFQLFEAVRTQAGIDARTLAEAFGASAPKLYYHLKILERAKLLYADGFGGRKRARGPDAVVYRACCAEFPERFFDSDAKAQARTVKLRRILAEAGLALVLPKGGLAAGGLLLTRREQLTPREEAVVRGHMAEITRVVEGARARRADEKSMARATVLVGLMLAPLDGGSLPDAPVDGL